MITTALTELLRIRMCVHTVFRSNPVDACANIIHVPRPVVQGGMQWYEAPMFT